MASKSLTFTILGRDKSASSAIKGVGAAAQGIQGTFLKLGSIIAGAFAVRTIIHFGEEAAKAFALAEKQQNKLVDAVKRYPAVQGANVKALQAWNRELAKTSRFDDDAIAGAEAQLLQYGLTEDQLRKLIPLTLDYAAKTGSDLATASEDLGKALLGSGRALKLVGIDFDDTGSVAGNFDAIIEGLSEKVGGFAQTDLTTAEGKLENLQNRFGEFQEQIGGAVMDVLGDLVTEFEGPLAEATAGFTDWLTGDGKEAIKNFVKFLGEHKDEILTWAGNIGALTTAVWLLNIAMSANPVGAFIAGLGLVATGVAYFTTVNRDAGKSFTDFWMGVYGTIADVFLNLAGLAEGFSNTIVDLLNALLGPINTIRSAFDLPALSIPKFDATSGLEDQKRALNLVGTATNLYYGATIPGTQQSTDVIVRQLGIAWGNSPTTSQQSTYDIVSGLGLASGGIVPRTPGGIPARIGEGRYDEMVMPITPEYVAALGGGGGVTVEIINNGGPGLMEFIDARIRYNDGRTESVLIGGKVPGK